MHGWIVRLGQVRASMPPAPGITELWSLMQRIHCRMAITNCGRMMKKSGSGETADGFSYAHKRTGWNSKATTAESLLYCVRAEKSKPDFILLDLAMPQLNEAAAVVKNYHAGSALCAEYGSARRYLCVDLGAGFISKVDGWPSQADRTRCCRQVFRTGKRPCGRRNQAIEIRCEPR